MHAPSRSNMQSDINVTPLVDVCLVLLIIFMVVVPTLVNGVQVKLPQAKTGTPVAEANRQLAITVTEEGLIYIDALALRREQLPGQLEKIHRETPQRPVSVRGDKKVKYGEVLDVLDACRFAGFADVGLISTTPTPAAKL